MSYEVVQQLRKNLSIVTKDRDDALAALKRVSSTLGAIGDLPSMKADVDTTIAKVQHNDPAERVTARTETSTFPVKLENEEWMAIRQVLPPGDSTGLKSRIFFSGMANAELGGKRTVNLSHDDSAAIVEALTKDIDQSHISMRGPKRALLKLIQDQIPAVALAQMDGKEGRTTITTDAEADPRYDKIGTLEIARCDPEGSQADGNVAIAILKKFEHVADANIDLLIKDMLREGDRLNEAQDMMYLERVHRTLDKLVNLGVLSKYGTLLRSNFEFAEPKPSLFGMPEVIPSPLRPENQPGNDEGGFAP